MYYIADMLIPVAILLVLVLCLIVSICGYGKYGRRPTREDRYRQLLRTEEWREKRSDIIEKHNCKCDWCGKTYDLQVHHKYYLRRKNGYMVDPWLYNDNCFMVLCSRCHNRYHKKYKVRTFTIE